MRSAPGSTSPTRLVSTNRPRPDEHVHPERGAIAGHELPDPPVTVDAQRLSGQRAADPRLPIPSLQRRDLLWDLAHRGEYERPRQLGRRVGGAVGVEVRAHRHPKSRTRFDVDVRIGAALADQAQVREAVQQRCADLGPFADEDQRVEAPKPLGEDLGVLHMIGEDGDLMARQLLKARQRAQGVQPVIEDRDLHRHRPRRVDGDRLPSTSAARAQTADVAADAGQGSV